jgi:prolyl-tRNA editing enzyme YbaK/EbsC (Cys-tRNA(Pro) deacylase)
MEYHPVVEKIKSILIERGVAFDTFEHEPVRTSEEASKVRTGYTIEQGTKALIARVKERGGAKRFVMLVVPGNKKFDPKKVKAFTGFTDIRFATEEEVAEVTGGVLPGGVPPFGNLFNLDVYADTTIFNNERIIFNAGDRSFSIGMPSVDYKSIVNPKIGDIAQFA